MLFPAMSDKKEQPGRALLFNFTNILIDAALVSCVGCHKLAQTY